MIAIKNCKYFKGSELVNASSVLIQDGKIIDFINTSVPDGFKVVDAGGALLTSGFTELQIYGSGGNLFSAYPSVETLAQMDNDLISKGTTSFLVCVATNSPSIVLQCIDAAKAYQSQAKGFLGLHLEGPYLNAKRLGAHVPEYVKKATLDEVKSLLEYADGTVKMMTIAAELQDEEVLNYLDEQGILLSLGHSDASFEQANLAFDKGFKTTTHLFNAMPSIHHRAPNLPTAVLNHPTAMASIIADGQHVDFEVVKLAYKLMKERLFLITDAVTACGIGPYQHQLSGNKFVTPEGTLSGSNITLLQAVQNCVKACGVPLWEALNMASRYPNELISGTKRQDNLVVGMKADLLLLSENLDIEKVFIGGDEHLIGNN